MDCRKDYLQKIETRPMEVWSPEFDRKTVREKKPIQEVEIGLSCDKCQISDSCPLFDVGSLCGIEWKVEKKSNKELLDWAIQIQAQRVNRANVIENMEGGVPDSTNSLELDRLQKLIQLQNDLEQDKFSLKIEGSASGNGGGILQSLFGDMTKRPAAIPETIEPQVVDVTPALLDSESIEFKEDVLEPTNKKPIKNAKALTKEKGKKNGK